MSMGLSFRIVKEFAGFQLNIYGEFQEGIIGIFGKSASGKTTLLKCLAGYLTPDQGKIIFNDEVYFSKDQQISRPLEQRRIGMVWQDVLLFPHLSVEQNVFYGCRKECPKNFSDHVLDILEVRPLLGRLPHHLSGGERQRVGIARALLHEPQLLLMDEPVSALDAQARRKVISYFRAIHEDFKIPIVYVSHSVSELLYLAQRVLIVENGRNTAYDTPERVFLNERQLAKLDEDFENMLELKVRGFDSETKNLDLEFGAQVIKAVCPASAAPRVARVSIKARDILISSEMIKGISARNKLAAVIERIEPAGPILMVCCRLNNQHLWVEVTPGAMRELRLHQSQLVYLVFKASSVRVLI